MLDAISSFYLNIPRPVFVYEIFPCRTHYLSAGPRLAPDFGSSTYGSYPFRVYHVGLIYYNDFYQILANLKFFVSHSYFAWYVSLQLMIVGLGCLYYWRARLYDAGVLKFQCSLAIVVLLLCMSFDMGLTKSTILRSWIIERGIVWD